MQLYNELLEFDFKYPELYEMDAKELINTINCRKKGLAYRMWKQANLISQATWSKNYPDNPKEASPELYPRKKGIKMPDFLREKYAKRGGR